METIDPFHHHPALRPQIKDAEASYFRDFSIEKVIAENPELKAFLPWALPDAERNRMRCDVLSAHTGDLWIFAYGSLMWDPALRFTSVRRAYAPDHARAFVLRDDKGGRGSAETPGLMAALVAGNGCQGLAYRIAASDIDTETDILFRREMIGSAYIPAFIPLQIDGQSVQALTFLANPDAPDTVLSMTRAEQVHLIATGEGTLGTSYAYLHNIVSQFGCLGVTAPYCADLLQEVDAYRTALPQKGVAA